MLPEQINKCEFCGVKCIGDICHECHDSMIYEPLTYEEMIERDAADWEYLNAWLNGDDLDSDIGGEG